MAVRTEERNSPERKYVIEKKVIDEGEDIEREIQRELGKSRVIRESRQTAVIARQTAAEIASEAAYGKGAGGRRRRIKTIKKFGQIIGKEEEILDEDGNVISVRKLGLDENDPAANFVAREEYVGSEASYAVGSRRAISSGRYNEDVSPLSGGFRAAGYGAGASAGYAAGTSAGYAAGTSAGYAAGTSAGYAAGAGAGAGAGYAAGAGASAAFGAGAGAAEGYGSRRHSEGRAYSSGRHSEGGYSSGRHIASTENNYGRFSPRGSGRNANSKGGYYVDDGAI